MRVTPAFSVSQLEERGSWLRATCPRAEFVVAWWMCLLWSALGSGGIHQSRRQDVIQFGTAKHRPARDAQATQGPTMLMRLSSETKHAFKTTEFWAMCAIIGGILIRPRTSLARVTETGTQT